MNQDMNTLRWIKVLGRWSDFPECGEKNLLVWALAHFIMDRNKNRELGDVEFYGPGGGFDVYCKSVWLNPAFVRQQIERSERAVTA